MTGVYPVNRDALSPPSLESETLSRETGLPFIPLYSPAARATGAHHFNGDTLCSPNQECDSFSGEIGLDSSSIYSPVPQHEPRKMGLLRERLHSSRHDTKMVTTLWVMIDTGSGSQKSTQKQPCGCSH